MSGSFGWAMNDQTFLEVSSRKGPDSGPFGREAIRLYQAGLAVIPCDDKRPLIRYAGLTAPIGLDGLNRLVEKHPNANVGMLTGLSKITVVDIDDPANAATMVARCGDTPLKVRTPSGGFHHWYRANGEISSKSETRGPRRRYQRRRRPCGGAPVRSGEWRAHGPHISIDRGIFGRLTTVTDGQVREPPAPRRSAGTKRSSEGGTAQ